MALLSRWQALDPKQDALLLLANSAATVDSLQPLVARFPDLPLVICTVNPDPLPIEASADSPARFDWPTPARWQAFRQSDRWARLTLAFQIGSQLDPASYLLLPAHDACWGPGLLPRLLTLSVEQARGGQPAAVSPYSAYRHAPLAGVAIPADIIDLINAAFNRDSEFPAKLARGAVQGFWGKTALLPCGLCATILKDADQTFFEDDAEIDRVIQAVGYATRGLWIADPAVYCQTLPVFDDTAARAVIWRTLHYSLPAGGSSLLSAPDSVMQALIDHDPRLAAAHQRAERLISECQTAIAQRLTQFGASWVDWGAYRYVVRVGDPAVEVWRCATD